ncbi:hypothetical protein [Pikeienuella sp. HZG-20]|uniref:hypothetical protein n=1 Tax=Paludibacillus litoralis TaxID=3133267 RepID=UPI0030ED2A60
MGLDIGFYTYNEETVLTLRKHHDFLDLFLEKPLVTLEPYSDFYVTPDMVAAVLADVEGQMRCAGMACPVLKEEFCETEGIQQGLPEGFCDEEPEDWEAALPYYRLLLKRLLAAVEDKPNLICGWSA